jgi:hypothetical protein
LLLLLLLPLLLLLLLWQLWWRLQPSAWPLARLAISTSSRRSRERSAALRRASAAATRRQGGAGHCCAIQWRERQGIAAAAATRWRLWSQACFCAPSRDNRNDVATAIDIIVNRQAVTQGLEPRNCCPCLLSQPKIARFTAAAGFTAALA